MYTWVSAVVFTLRKDVENTKNTKDVCGYRNGRTRGYEYIGINRLKVKLLILIIIYVQYPVVEGPCDTI